MQNGIPPLISIRVPELSISSFELKAITKIYEDHVLNGTGTFEIKPPNLAEMQQRLTQITAKGHPVLIAEDQTREIIGFAYCSCYNTRMAYQGTVENSIYIKSFRQGQGFGKQLLQRLIDICNEKGYRQIIARIGDSTNLGSIILHEKLGFKPIGTAKNLGYKFGRFLDVVYMQREL